MSFAIPASPATGASQRLAGAPVAQHGDHWWLVAPTGALRITDQAFTADLDRFAADLAAADRAVAALRPHPGPERSERR